MSFLEQNPPAVEAGNPARATWADVPPEIRDRIAERAGSTAVGASGVRSGFSPGFAGVLDFADGHREFVKAVDAAPHAEAGHLNRAEATANAALPGSVPVPRLLWWEERGTWVLSSFEVARGRAPAMPWNQRDLTLVLEGLTDLARRTVPPGTFGAFADEHAGVLTQWQAFADLDVAEREAQAARAGAVGTWVLNNVDALVEWASRAPQATAGDALVHGDIRADNILIDGDRAWIVDWAYASVGAPWADLAGFLPSVEMQGGGSAHEIFAAHPLARGVAHEDLRALVAAFVGFLFVHSLRPEVPEIPTLRAFQWAQAVPTIRWLRALEPGLAP